MFLAAVVAAAVDTMLIHLSLTSRPGSMLNKPRATSVGSFASAYREHNIPASQYSQPMSCFAKLRFHIPQKVRKARSCGLHQSNLR